MPRYRLDFIGASGAVVEIDEIDTENDRVALKIATFLLEAKEHHKGARLWDGETLIGTIVPERCSSP